MSLRIFGFYKVVITTVIYFKMTSRKCGGFKQRDEIRDCEIYSERTVKRTCGSALPERTEVSK